MTRDESLERALVSLAKRGMWLRAMAAGNAPVTWVVWRGPNAAEIADGDFSSKRVTAAPSWREAFDAVTPTPGRSYAA